MSHVFYHCPILKHYFGTKNHKYTRTYKIASETVTYFKINKLYYELKKTIYSILQNFKTKLTFENKCQHRDKDEETT